MPPIPPPDASAAPAEAAGARLRVLLVDDGAHRIGMLREALEGQGCDVVGVVDSAPVLHEAVARERPDVIIVDSEAPSRDTLEHLATLSASNPRPVVVFAEDDADDPLQQALAAGVSAYVIAGLQPERLTPVLRVAMARFAQERAVREELAHARGELDQRRRIERAKGILARARRLDEHAAYHLLRRMAMDRGEKLAAVADRVIAADDLLGLRD